jgi:signal transduction histidine kinase/pSer/pThr/pTyr-binding forkhead associated (FHA) protein
VSSLFVIKGRDQGKRFELVDRVLGVGRDRSNPIQLNDAEVSRRHAELRRDDAGYALIDLNSANGTYLNYERVSHAPLRSGDKLQLGRTLMLFTGDDGSSHDMTSGVDIITQNLVENSRIVRSMGQEEGSQILHPVDTSESPWLARARSNLQIMYRTALAVSHTLDIDQLLNRIMELIFEWVEADRGCIMLADHETDELKAKVVLHRQGVASSESIQISRTIVDYVMERKEGVLTSDAREDQRWDPAGSIVKLGVREAICVPLQGRYGIVGLVYIDTFTPPGRLVPGRAGRRFSEEHLKLMVAIGHQAALAVEDTSYYSAMVQAERLAAMGQTIATLSHHIKNILQGIRGGSYLIDEGLKTEETEMVRTGWRMVEKNQEKISNLVMDMLTFSKERKPELVPADMNQVAADVVELMQSRAGEARVGLVWRPAEKMPELTFDPEGLHRAILNVVTNAIDACEKKEGASVTVAAEYSREERVVRVIVSDTGEGIEPDDVKRIFSVFESKKGSRGTGLGLPVSQKILHEHGGDIRVESAPGAGSKFTLELPAIPPERTGTGETMTGRPVAAGEAT